MENKLFEVAKKIDEVQKALDRAKAAIFKKGSESNVPVMVDIAIEASTLLDEVVIELEDLEMAEVDFDGINLDKAFEGNPVSDYVTALADYSLGDVEATKRMHDAMDRINAADLYVEIMDRDAKFTERLLEDLYCIENALEGTDIDNWSHEQVELARYFLSFQADTTLSEIELLTPHGVGLAWKRRRYQGFAK